MSVTAASGFRAAGVTAGLKPSGKPDLALVVNDGPEHVGAAVFTSNRVEAAPVTWSRQVVTDGRVDAVVLNSGGANACTGAQGFLDTHRTAELVAEAAGVSAGDVVVCSTGLIGELLPMDRIENGVTQVSGAVRADGGADAAEAIMTTDTVAKECEGIGSGYVVGGMAKGAGMLAPSLATMLVVVTTDAVLTSEQADEALRTATRLSFDRIDSDGCQSTNDTVLLMSSGASGVAPEMGEFTSILTEVCQDLALQLITDAEGAAHDIEIVVNGAANINDGLEVARAIARNNLFKCAVFGGDPNWGRVLAAVGTTKAAFDARTLDVAINGVMVCRDGGVGDGRPGVDLSNREVKVEVFLKAGEESVTIFTNDLTHDYVHENSAYST